MSSFKNKVGGSSKHITQRVKLPPQFSSCTISDIAVPESDSTVLGIGSWEGDVAIIDYGPILEGSGDPVVYYPPTETTGKSRFNKGFGKYQHEKADPVLSLCFQENDTLDLFYGDACGCVKKIVAGDGKKAPEQIFKCGGPVIGLKWDNSARCVFALSLDGRLAVFDPSANKIIRVTVTKDELPVGFDVSEGICCIATITKVFKYTFNSSHFDDNEGKPEIKADEMEGPVKYPRITSISTTIGQNDVIAFLGVGNNVYMHGTKDPFCSRSREDKGQYISSTFLNNNKVYFAGDSKFINIGYDKKVEKIDLSKDISNDIIKIVQSSHRLFIVTGYDWNQGASIATENSEGIPESSVFIYYKDSK